MATVAAAIAHVSLLPVTVVLGAANSDGEEIKVCPTVAADTTIDTADTLVAMSKRKKVLDAALSASAAALKKSRTTKSKKPPINLCQFPTYAVTNNCMKHCVNAITHGRKWVTGNLRTITGSIANKPLSNHQWHKRCPLSKKVFPGNSNFENMTPLEAFLMMMPPDELNLNLELTNKNLKLSSKKELSLFQELLHWFGMTLLMSALIFRRDCRTLWEGGGSISKYLPPLDLKVTEMSCNCWEDIWYAIRWSHQLSEKLPKMTSERYQWMLVDDNVRNFNDHRASTF
jgi:hypothetical protein